MQLTSGDNSVGEKKFFVLIFEAHGVDCELGDSSILVKEFF